MFVSVNARLNYVGFLDLSSIGGDTNVGVADMVLSLQWVRDNIAKFGGDPSNVTILGQSGGGTKVTALASAPAAQGLFSKVAYISGGTATGRSPEEAAANAQKLVDYVRANVADLAKASDAEIFAYLQDLHYDTLVKHCEGAGGTYNVLYSLGDCFFYFMPILLAYTASKKFGLPELEGMVIGAGLLYPYLLSSSTMVHDNIFGIPVVMPSTGDYTSSVIPIICAIAFAAWFEKLYAKHIPSSIKLFGVPVTTCTVTFCLTLWVIGPITSLAAQGLSAIFTVSRSAITSVPAKRQSPIPPARATCWAVPRTPT